MLFKGGKQVLVNVIPTVVFELVSNFYKQFNTFSLTRLIYWY